ncbi:MAG: 2'-5' RNA ligase family protein [Caldilinea sp.]|uniref:2'-5' RNA ligase family protein n=1 Tax=Caldilinea sp. TaxID=2293560 RepID=UPI0030974C44
MALEIAPIYDALWRQAMAHYAEGRVEIDPYLAEPQNDRRLGVTVIARPSPEVIERLMTFIRRMVEVEPEQYFYRATDLHVTILSLFTATERWEPHFARLSDYLDACAEVLSQAERFTVEFRGVTAAPGAILCQGFPCNEALNALRDRLREALHRRNLGQGLDVRYRLVTAHMTLMRFQRPPSALPLLIDLLQAHRDVHFGQTTFASLQVVKNDWCMRTEKVEALAEHRLL